MKKLLLCLMLLAFSLTFASAISADSSADVAVIVSKSSPIRSTSKDELRLIFLTLKKQWADGSKATPINLPEDNKLRQSFDLAVTGMDPDRVAQYWTDRKIRGGERPPKKVTSTGAMLSAIGGDDTAVGYVAPGEVTSDVRVIARVQNGNVVGP